MVANKFHSDYTFNNGIKVPVLGFGTFQSKPGEVEVAIKAAIKAGYRHIDCAYVYANQTEIGLALKECFETGLVKREDLFITSKLWNNTHRPETVELGIKKCLEELQLDYLDLYLIHWPVAFKYTAIDDKFPKEDDKVIMDDEATPLACYQAMEKLVDQKLTKSIGISNFDIEQTKEVLDNCRIKPVTNQIELHPLYPNPALVNYLTANGVVPTAYCPLGGNPARESTPDNINAINEQDIKDMAQKRGCTPANILIQWGLQKGFIVLPKSVNPERIETNFKSVDILSDGEMAVIDKYGEKPVKAIDVAVWKHSIHYPKC